MAKSNWSFCWLDCAMEIPTSSELERESLNERQAETERGELPVLPTKGYKTRDLFFAQPWYPFGCGP